MRVSAVCEQRSAKSRSFKYFVSLQYSTDPNRTGQGAWRQKDQQNRHSTLIEGPLQIILLAQPSDGMCLPVCPSHNSHAETVGIGARDVVVCRTPQHPVESG